MTWRRAVVLVSLGAIWGGAGNAQTTAVSAPAPVRADETELDRRTRELASQLRCPVCQGLSIQDSPSELALEMKGVVRDQLAAGQTPEQVTQYFIDKYGEWILLEPKPTGANLLVYVLPLLAVAVGGLVVWRAVQRWTAPNQGSAPGL